MNASKEVFKRVTGIDPEEAPNAYINWLEEQINNQKEIEKTLKDCENDLNKVNDKDVFYG